jgi:nucleolar protein 58
MTLFILAETSAGYALLKSKDKKLLKSSTIAKDTETAEGVCELYASCTNRRCCGLQPCEHAH